MTHISDLKLCNISVLVYAIVATQIKIIPTIVLGSTIAKSSFDCLIYRGHREYYMNVF